MKRFSVFAILMVLPQKIEAFSITSSSILSQQYPHHQPFKVASTSTLPSVSFISRSHDHRNSHILNLFPSAHAMASSTATFMSSIPKHNSFYVLSSILVLSSFGIILEQKTIMGKALSAPLATMAMALVIANLGFIPFASPIYDFTNRFLIPLAIPLLLYDSNLRRVITDTGSLLLAFIVGSFSTVISTILTSKLIPLSSLGDNGWKISSALTARHIGGAINFVSVCETLNVNDGSIVSAAIAADNVVVALYFAFLFYLAIPGEEKEDGEEKGDCGLMVAEGSLDVKQKESDENGYSNSITMLSLSVSLAVASCLVTIGKVITGFMLPAGASALPLISIVTVIGATIFPNFFQSIRSTGTAIGIIFMQMFFAASGAAGSIALVLKSAPSLFLFSAIQIAIHFGSLMSIGKLIFKLQSKELYLASNANVGGPTTAAAMATAKDWNRLTLPALLVGILGYATATPIALAVGKIWLCKTI